MFAFCSKEAGPDLQVKFLPVQLRSARFEFLVLIARAVAVRAAPHHRPAGGADVALPLNHAGCDAIHVRDTVPAEALGVALAGRALIGRTLGSGRHRYERRGPYRDGGKNSRDQVAHTIFVKVVG
jgi:hypothetical protein